MASQNNGTLVHKCVRSVEIDPIQLYRWMLIPAILCILLFAFLRRRRKLAPGILHGRPGLPRPLYFLDEEHSRWLFVGGFVVAVWIMLEIGFKDFLGLGKPHFMLEFWDVTAKGIVVGILCYPLIGGVTSGHIIGYGASTLYVWTLTICLFIMHAPCENPLSDHDSVVRKNFAFIKNLPCLCCLAHISIIYAYRLIYSAYGKRCTFDKEPTDLSYMVYVRRLLTKHLDKEQPDPRKLPFKKRLSQYIKGIYVPIKGFRYSVTILSGVFASILAVYILAVMLIRIVFVADAFVLMNITSANDSANNTDTEFKISIPEGYQQLVNLATYFLEKVGLQDAGLPVVRFSAYTAVATAFMLTSLSLLCTLKEHRRNLIDCYKKNLIDLPTYEQPPRGVIVDAIRYLGYQIGFGLWGFFGQVFVLVIPLYVVSMAVVIFFRDPTSKIADLAIGGGATIIYVVTLLIIQCLLVYYCFLQRNAEGRRVLAIDNRGAFANFNYFMIFPNATTGLLVCMARVLCAVLVSLWTLPRLDRCALARQFEKFDRGYTAYIGLLRMESAMTNPTMLAFVYLLSKVSQPATEATDGSKSHDQSTASWGTKLNAARRKLIINRFHLWITLARNPGLRQWRKKPSKKPLQKEKIDKGTTTATSRLKKIV